MTLWHGFHLFDKEQQFICCSKYSAKTTNFLFLNLLLSGDETEKIWAHRFLEKPKTIEKLGGPGRAVSPPSPPPPWSPGQYLGEHEGANPQNNFPFFFSYKAR